MSLGQIVTVLMYHSMRWVPEDPGYPTSDRLVLSEGHAVPIVYAAFADLGAHVGGDGERRPTTMTDLDEFRATDSPLDGHPNPRRDSPSSMPRRVRWARDSRPRPVSVLRPGWTGSTSGSSASSATVNPARDRSPRRSTSSWTTI